MAKNRAYRKSSGAAIQTPELPRPGRWLCVLLFLVVVAAIISLVAGPYTLTVFETFLYGAFTLTLLLAAAMLGLALTTPLARRNLFADSPWPAALRLVLSIALGLGALALLMLGAGSFGLASERWLAPVLLLACATIGLVPTHQFFRTSDWSPLTAPARGIDLLALLAAPPVAMLLIAATYPPGTLWSSEGRGYDVLEYHLQLPREYAALGFTTPLHHNVYSFFPANIEMLYLLLLQLANVGLHSIDHLQVIYPAQFLHAALMLLAAAAVALVPVRIGPLGRWLAVALFLGTPWTIVCGSLAYNDAGVLLFGALALTFALGPRGNTTNLIVGVLLGLALGCKLTAVLAVILPIIALLLITRGWRSAAIAAGLTLLLFLPWAARAAAASGGNPIFPLAASILPHDGWMPAQVDNFNRGHAPSAERQSFTGRLSALGPELLWNLQWGPGLASVDQWNLRRMPSPPPWKTFGLIWLVIPFAVVFALLPTARAPGSALALFALLALQLLGWLFFTHLQARFLLPCLIPLALLVALGIESSATLAGGIPRTVIATLIGLQAFTAIFLLIPEQALFTGSLERDRRTKEPALQPIGFLIKYDSGPKLYLLGNSAVFYYRQPLIYNTVFDTNPLAEQLRTGGPAAAAAWLTAQDVGQVQVNWNEIERFRKTYGYDPAITRESVEAIVHAAKMYPVASPGPNIDVWEIHP